MAAQGGLKGRPEDPLENNPKYQKVRKSACNTALFIYICIGIEE